MILDVCYFRNIKYVWYFRIGFLLSVYVFFNMKFGICILLYVIFVRIKWISWKESWIKLNGEWIWNLKLFIEDLFFFMIMILLFYNENIFKEYSRLFVFLIVCFWRNFVNKIFIFDI